MTNLASSEVPKAYSYMRFSTLEQGKGDSLNRQTMMAREWAEKRDVPERVNDFETAQCGI
jgi:hypothetical protein